MTLGVVIPCFKQEQFLPRTLAALERALAGKDWSGVIVSSAPGAEPPQVSGRWRVIAPPITRPLTPGASRMLGLAAIEGDWVLFVDADVEVDAAWTEACLARMASSSGGPAGYWGRIEEWFVDDRGERAGSSDLLRTGMRERDVPFLTAVGFYRRDALVRAGGYEPRLRSEEDFELGLRLTQMGETLRLLDLCAGRHWSAPRPSLGELVRRWSSGLCFGQGQVLRLYVGRPGFGRVLGRQRIYLITLGAWLVGFLAALFALTGEARPFVVWGNAAVLAFVAMSLRKRSARLAAFSFLTWTLNGAGLVVGALRGLEPVQGFPEGSRP